MTRLDDGLLAALLERGVSRRSFLKFSAAMATALALPATYAPRIAAAVATAPRLPVIWLRGQDCAGNTEAFLRATEPDGLGARPGPAVDRLPRDAHGPERRRGHPCPDDHDGEVPGRVPRDRRGRDPDRGRRRLLHDRRPPVPGHRPGGLPTGRWPRSPSARARSTAAPLPRERRSDRRRRRGLGHRRRTPHHAAGLPAQRREPDGDDRPLPDLQGVARRPTGEAGPSSPTAASSTTSASGAPTSSSASSPWPGATREPRRAGASTSWAARGPRPSPTARPSVTAAGRAGPSRRATAASAARCPASGTR